LISVTDTDVAAYDRDGVVCLRGAFDAVWVGILGEAVERDLVKPGPHATNFAEGSTGGKFFGDMFMWQQDNDFRLAALTSPATEIAARFMGSPTVDFFYDQLFVKEPGTAHPTPWHQDQPYWPVTGWQIASVWIALDEITLSNGASSSPGRIAGASTIGRHPSARGTRRSSPRATSPRSPTSMPTAASTTSSRGPWSPATAWSFMP
jgi:Phytanoyl-CoA dioxygenase (PhyH)